MQPVSKQFHRVIRVCVFFLLTLLAGSVPAQTQPSRLQTIQQVLQLLEPRGLLRLPSNSPSQVFSFREAVAAWSTREDMGFHQFSGNSAGRWARVPQFKAEYVEAAKYAYAVPYGSIPGTAATFIPNPDTVLKNFSVTADLSQAFPSIQDRSAACKAANDAEGQHLIVGDIALRNYNCRGTLQYLTGGRTRDKLERTVSAITFTYQAAQNSKVSNGVLTPSGPVTYSSTYTGSFDPKKIWRTAGDWKSVVESLDGNTDFPANFPGVSSSAGWQFDRFAYGWTRHRFWEALIPQIDVKAVTASTTQMSSNIFVSAPTDERKVLYTGSATWDLRNLLPNAAGRNDAAGAVTAMAMWRQARMKKLLAEKTPDTEAVRRRKIADHLFALADDSSLATNPTWWKEFQEEVVPED